MFLRQKLRRIVSLLVLVSTLLLQYQAFAHAHIAGSGISVADKVVTGTMNPAADSSDIFGLETAQGSCHIFNHLTGVLADIHAEIEPVSPVLISAMEIEHNGIPDLPPSRPPKQ